MKNIFKIGDTVKVRETCAIGVIKGIYKIGRKEMLILENTNKTTIKISSDACTNYN